VHATFVLVLTTLAFLTSLFVVPPPVAHANKGDAAIGAARLAMVHVAKPVVRKAERTSGPAMEPRVLAVSPAAFVRVAATAPPKQHRPSAPDRFELMVFLN
jgi:hypothetical protein